MTKQANEIKAWIVKGDHDLGTAKITYYHIPEYLDTVTFHCQQAIEKYLKGYLISQSTPFKFSHDLIYLLDLITEKDSEFKVYYDILSELQGYAVEIRYPNEMIFLSKEKVEGAIKIAKEIRDVITGKLNMQIEYNDIIDK